MSRYAQAASDYADRAEHPSQTSCTASADPVLKIKALADETRIEIVRLLAAGTLCACDILETFEITQPTLSYHMKLLTASGLVDSRRVGKWTHYTLNGAGFQKLAEFLSLVVAPGNGPAVRYAAGCGTTARRCSETS